MIQNISKNAVLMIEQECAKHGVPFDLVCDRLRKGCSLYAALNVPNILDIEINEESGRIHYKIVELMLAEIPVFDGTESELEEFIAEKRKESN